MAFTITMMSQTRNSTIARQTSQFTTKPSPKTTVTTIRSGIQSHMGTSFRAPT
jgi:hypothetical protein